MSSSLVDFLYGRNCSLSHTDIQIEKTCTYAVPSLGGVHRTTPLFILLHKLFKSVTILCDGKRDITNLNLI